jgi:hypothetical protein
MYNVDIIDSNCCVDIVVMLSYVGTVSTVHEGNSVDYHLLLHIVLSVQIVDISKDIYTII